MRLHLTNRSGYDTRDLERFVRAGARAMGVERHLAGRTLHVEIVPSPIHSRGCAEVDGCRMVLAIAAPSRFTMRRFGNLIEHEYDHILGSEHKDMSEKRLYSLGPTPGWCRGLRLRYRGRPREKGWFEQ